MRTCPTMRGMSAPHVVLSAIALSFSEFFIGKITSIRETLEAQQQAVPDAPPTSSREPCSVHMSTFTPASIEEVTKIVKRSASTTCSLDPIPTPLLKDCLDELAPSIAQIVNRPVRRGGSLGANEPPSEKSTTKK